MIVFKEFLLNRGISQHANLIILKPSGVTCECESSCRSHTARETFLSLLCTHGRLHCLDHTAVGVCTYVRTSVGNDSDKSFCSWGETDLKLLITLVFQSPTLFYRNILAALSANVTLSARNQGVVFDCILYLKNRRRISKMRYFLSLDLITRRSFNHPGYITVTQFTQGKAKKQSQAFSCYKAQLLGL